MTEETDPRIVPVARGRDQRYEFHRHVMMDLQNAIRLADAKVSLLLVILGASLAPVVKKWHLVLTADETSGGAVALLLLTSAVYAVSIGYAIAVFKPRLPTTLDKGLIFFMDIRGHADPEAYVNSALLANPEALLESVLRQNWSLAGIVERKFRYTAHAITASVGYLILAVACVLLL